jgi:hypothetical protein
MFTTATTPEHSWQVQTKRFNDFIEQIVAVVGLHGQEALLFLFVGLVGPVGMLPYDDKINDYANRKQRAYR